MVIDLHSIFGFLIITRLLTFFNNNFYSHRKTGAASCTGLFLSFSKESAVLSHLGEAVAAVNRTVALGLEGNLGLAAAGSAGSGEILTGTAGSVLAGVTAGLAALGLILEASLCIELLLTGGEHELVATFFAN
jgi:hypothetical protein